MLIENTNILNKTIFYIKNVFKDDCSGHDWWHIYRVWQLSKAIHESEGGDSFILEMAALLHDLDDHKFTKEHNDEIPSLALEWLSKFEIDNQTIEQITSIIVNVSFKGAYVGDRMISLEGMIIQDADRLDAIGAIGVARVFAYGGYKGHSLYDPSENPNLHKSFDEYKLRKSSSINHFYEKLLLLKDRMHTETGKEIAIRRHQFLKKYLDEFFIEWDAKDLEQHG